ncbi:MAG: rRNA adenine N-6-methyltransferase family protein, partial [Verrucomicrobiota bacterium]|nr:rRNA adenine N-6-methyltransferase family protein [Verrucomicrobiota bacterium]
MPLSPTATRELLEQLEHLPKKKLGQNFLVDGNIVRKSIELAELDADSFVVEIGPGLGTLTKAILKKPTCSMILTFCGLTTTNSPF